MFGMSPELIWILVGLGLLITEAMISGFIAVFFGLGALATGLAIAFGVPAAGALPWIIFSVVSVGSLLVLRQQFARWMRGDETGEGASGMGAEDDFVGFEATVVSGFGPDEGGRGQVHFRGANWAARAEPAVVLGPQALVRIVRRDNISLIIESAQ